VRRAGIVVVMAEVDDNDDVIFLCKGETVAEKAAAPVVAVATAVATAVAAGY